MLGLGAIYHDGWKAVTYHPVGPVYDDGLRANAPCDDDVWELYHVAEDVSESRDLAAEFPEKVAELVALWWEEARRNDVLPLDNRVLEAIVHKHDRRRPQADLPLLPGRSSGARVGGRRRPQPLPCHGGHRRRPARRVVPSGTLLALGCALGGWSFHLVDGRLRYVHNLHGQRLYEVVADTSLGSGRHEVAFRFEKDEGAGGQAALVQDGAGRGRRRWSASPRSPSTK